MVKKSILWAVCVSLITGFTTPITGQTAPQDLEMKQAKNLMIDSVATGPVVELQTNMGNITVRLYDDTPAHRDNFIKHVQEGDYTGVLFHRVIKDFMVQTGDLNSKNPDNQVPLGAGDCGYTLAAEIDYPRHFHKYGALAAARTGDQVNPEKRSSGSQFYIVTGNVYGRPTIERMAQKTLNDKRQAYFRNLVQENRALIESLQTDSAALEDLRTQLIARTEAAVVAEPLDEKIVNTYSTIGGTPHLDGAYTVFGEVLSGMDVVEKIQNTPTDYSDNPLTPVVITGARILSKD